MAGSVLSPARLGGQGRSYFLGVEITARCEAVAARLKMPIGTFCRCGQSLCLSAKAGVCLLSSLNPVGPVSSQGCVSMRELEKADLNP